MSTKSTQTWALLREYALGLPGAQEDFPWGESVVKVNKKIFVFLGHSEQTDGKSSLTVKLPHSGQDALEVPGAQPTGYGLGKAGWVSLSFAPGEELPFEVLAPWIEESYRAIAPKRLAAQLSSPQPDVLKAQAKAKAEPAKAQAKATEPAPKPKAAPAKAQAKKKAAPAKAPARKPKASDKS